MKALFLTLALSSALMSAAPQPLMMTPGERIVSWQFNRESDADKKWLSFRKETVYKVEDGSLHVIPPAIANQGIKKESDWATSSFARTGLVGLPQDYVCQLRWKCNQPTDPKALAKGLVYIDLGHRGIRTTFSREGTTLLLENHLMGRDAEVRSKILQTEPGFSLEYNKWYDIVAEVKGSEVVIQIDDHTFYGKDDLIAGERYDTFNLDSNGAGFLVDKLEIRAAGPYRADWKAKRKQLAKR